MIYLNDHIGDINTEQALTLVGEQRRQKALRYHQQSDRQLSLAAYLLLCDALKREYGISEPPTLQCGPNGKPQLADYRHIHFNLSHCRCAALCVVDEHEVGCDIEVVGKTVDMEMCRHCFNEREIDTILHAKNPPLEFTTLWTQKEAYLKLTGTGLTDNLPAVLSGEVLKSINFRTFTAPDGTYVYTVCHKKTAMDDATSIW